MDNKFQHIIELLKYPVLVFSIVVAVLILKFSLGLEFGMVTEFSTNGLKFSEKSNKVTLEAITEIESKLNELTIKVASLEQNAGASIKATQLEAFSASQEVSDATATIAKLKSGVKTETLGKTIGYIWIGNYGNKWEKSPLARIDTGQVNTLSPDKMVIGTQYRVLGNMVIRDGLPPNNKEYYRARKSLGVIPRNSIVTILSKPEEIDREFAVQYWVKVEFIRD